ncbi:MAG: hypothetical protein O3C39_10765 [Planctomycetota bacterium]|nr:hypothetical protein [Planctomycetota bacterium]MDA1202152.1 hypothetical protein [Planctomycetota bacterium]
MSQAAVALGLACRALSLSAGDDMVSERVASPPAETVRFRGGDIRLMGIANGRLSIDLGTTFDQQVFGRSAAGGRAVIIVNGVVMRQPQAGQAATDTLEKLSGIRGQGEAWIAAIDRICGLTPSQRQRLELALASDLERLAFRIDTLRRKYVGREFSPAGGGIDPETIARLRTDATTCRRLLTKPFDNEALLPAVVDTILNAEQAAAIESLLKRRTTVEVTP